MNEHERLQEILKTAGLKKHEYNQVWRLMKQDGFAAAEAYIASRARPASEQVVPTEIREEPVPYQIWGRDYIEDGALEQMRGSARLPVTLAGALMPDAHQGYGLPIGGVLATDNVVIPYAVGVDIACLSGDTKVPLLDGNEYTLQELASREAPFPVYACKPDGKVVIAYATAFKTKENAQVIQVKLDNGQIVTCTPDHEFMLRDGAYCEAVKLQPGASLMPLYSKTDQDGYTRIMQNYSGAWLKAHWMVARAGMLGDINQYKGQKVVVHHIDFCKTNNLPQNLMFMNDEEHASYHRSLVEKNTYWQSAEFEEKRKQALARKAQTPEGYAYFAQRGGANLKSYWEKDYERAKANCAGNGERGKVYLAAKNSSEKGRQKSREIGARIYVCDLCGKHIKSAGGMGGHYARTHGKYGGIKHLEYYNHKVVSVTPLETPMDVYCLNVPVYENFAISSGIFVHNCRMMLTVYPVAPKILNQAKEKQRLQDALVKNTIFGAGADGLHSGKIEHEVLYASKWDDLPLLRELRITGIRQIGTSGTGNHFVEWCDFDVSQPNNPLGLDVGSYLALLSHSGSRGVGFKIASYYSELAMKLMPGLPQGVKHLAWLPLDSDAGKEYWHAMELAGEFASANHHVIHERVAKAAGLEPIASVENHHNFCIPATEYIPTPDGPRTITELKAGSKVYTYEENNGLAETQVIDIFYSGKKPIYTITTAHRKLRVSGDHPILTYRDHWEWIIAKDIRIGDPIACVEGYYSRSACLQSGEARFIGAYLGDGWIRQDPARQGYTFGLAIGTKLQLHTQRYYDLILSLELPEIEQRTHKHGTLRLKIDKPGAFGITGSNKRFYQYIVNWGLGVPSTERHIPSILFTASLKDKLDLLSGYFDADGSIGNLKTRDASGVVRCVNEPLAYELREIAISAGLDCTPVRKKIIATNFGETIVSAFNISPLSMKCLDLWHVEKRAIVDAAKSRPVKNLLGADMFMEKVKSILITGEEDVYDLTVNHQSHSFVCSGIVVHNCWRETIKVDGQKREAIVHRKGATPAGAGVLGIIPGSMGDAGYVISGKGSAAALNSASHGAGRLMSRNKAKHSITPQAQRDYLKKSGVTLIGGGLDESPQAYKRIEKVIAAQADLVQIIGKLQPRIVRMADDVPFGKRKPVPQGIEDAESD